MEKHIHEFHMMEYAAVRSQLAHQYQNTSNWFVYVITANAIIVSWLSTQNGLGSVHYVAAVLPLIVSVLGHAIFIVSYRSIRAMIEYLKRIDNMYGPTIGFGAYYDGLRQGSRLPSTIGLLSGMFVIVEVLSLIFLLIVVFSS